MSGISTSSYYSASTGSKSNGISGLASGMDTDAMVEKMLSGTQNAIDKQEALKQQTTWKQEIYRDIISTVNSFYGKYFDARYGAAATNNFANTAFFDSMLSAVTKGSNALRVLSTGSDAAMGDIRVKVKELAASAKLESTKRMSGDQKIRSTALDEPDAATGKSVLDNVRKKVAFKIGDSTTVEVDMSSINTEEEMLSTLNRAFESHGVTVKAYNGQLRFVTDDPTKKVTVDGTASTALGLKMTGLSGYSASEVKDADGNVVGNQIQGRNFQADAGYSITMSLDGVPKTITINKVESSASGVTAEALKNAMQAEVKKAFGEYVTVGLKDGKYLEFGLNVNGGEQGHQLDITGLDAQSLGIRPGSSTNINMGSTLKELGVSGDRMSFTLNGVDFTFSSSDSIGVVINKINNGGAGVRLTYSSLSDTFQMEATSTGSKFGIDIQQKEGDLFSVMFGKDKIAEGATVASSELTVNNITGKAGGLAADFKTEAISLTMNVNGKDYTFEMKKDGDKLYTKDDIDTAFNTWLKNSFGKKEADGTYTPTITYADGKLQIPEGFQVKFAATKVDTEDPEAMAAAQKSDLALALGFNTKATSNIATAATPISEIHQFAGLDIKDQYGNPATTVADIRTIDGHAVSFSGGRLTMTGSGTVDISDSAGLVKLFGRGEFELSDGKTAANVVKEGVDAVVIVNGVQTTRSSNTITIDGITMELTDKSKEILGADGSVIGLEESVINTKQDTETIFNGFKSFVEDYNKMLEKLNGYTGEDAEYKEYPPLTAAQKKDMSESEVKLWEEKAKKGLIRRDSTVEQFLSEMRTLLYTKPAGSKYALYDLGIATTTDYKSKGKLELNEADLRSALATDPDAIKKLFTDSTEGLSKLMMGAMDRAAKESIGSPGTLVQLAGVKGGSTEKANTLYDRLTGIENRIKDLKAKYAKEKARYWRQFNSMESVLSNYNSQSAWLSQQFGAS